MQGELIFRNEEQAFFEEVVCPKCGHHGAESYNASTPIVWHCPRCNELWNPDNLYERKPIKVGDDITVGDLREGDIVIYLFTRGTGKHAPFQRAEMVTVVNENPYSQMNVTDIDNYGVTLLRPYVFGKAPQAETIHFRFDSSMRFRLLYRL